MPCSVPCPCTKTPSVLLVRPLCEGDEPEFAEPLGIERLAGYLQEHGVRDVCVCDRRLYAAERRAHAALADAPSFYEELRAKYPVGFDPDVVGLSLMTASDVPDALRVMSRLGSWWPKARFVVGGVYVTHAAEEVARRFPRGTTLLRGEGEVALLDFVRGYAKADVRHACAPDEWARPYRRDLERYARLGCAVNMQTSRGCPGTCTFCATPQLPAGLRRWQPRSLRLVADEIQFEASRLERAGLPPICNFVDDDFGPLSRAEELADELGRRELRVAFSLEMRMAALVREPNLARRLERLREAGLTRVFVGVESLDPATLKRWHKSYDVHALPQVVSAFASAGVPLQVGYILWHKDQTPQGAQSEVEALWRLGIYTHQMALSRLIVFPGCALATQTSSRGFESLAPDAEFFYRRFAERTDALRVRWLRAALREPHVAARAWLDGNTSERDALRAELADVNRLSYEAYADLCAQARGA